MRGHLGPLSTIMKGSMRQHLRLSPLDKLKRRHLDTAHNQITTVDFVIYPTADQLPLLANTHRTG